MHELGAWTMDLLGTEFVKRIDRVRAYTQKDDKERKKKIQLSIHLSERNTAGENEERIKIGNYFEIGATFALIKKDLFTNESP
eukprot:101406-Amphidinium_carterae.3